MNESRLMWFEPTPPALHLAQGDSALVLAAVRDTAGDTLDLASLPPGRLGYEIADRAVVAVRASAHDTVHAVFGITVTGASAGTDTVRLAWLTTMCLSRTSLVGPRQCFAAAWFAPVELPVAVY